MPRQHTAGTHARRILGVPVSGGLETLDTLIQSARIEEVLLSSPDIGDAAERRVRDICGARGIPVRRLHLEIR